MEYHMMTYEHTRHCIAYSLAIAYDGKPPTSQTAHSTLDPRIAMHVSCTLNILQKNGKREITPGSLDRNILVLPSVFFALGGNKNEHFRRRLGFEAVLLHTFTTKSKAFNKSKSLHCTCYAPAESGQKSIDSQILKFLFEAIVRSVGSSLLPRHFRLIVWDPATQLAGLSRLLNL